MPSFTLTDYLTLQDGTRRFDGTPNSIDLDFTLPSDFVQGTNLAKPVISFKFRAHQETDIELWVNPSNSGQNVQINTTFESTTFFRTYHEFINGATFIPGAQNSIRFILTDHSVFDDANNDISISDVMLTFQRRIEI